MSAPTTVAEPIVLDGVSKTYPSSDGEVIALSPTSLTIEPGEFVAVVGPSGCGKTTLLQILAGFVTPTAGSATVGGTPVDGPDPDRGVVFQAPTLYPWLSVRGNVEFGPRARGESRADRGERALQALDLVGLKDFADKRPYELSGGMQQRAQIARVFVNNPGIVLMDEPYSALDPFTREQLQVQLLDLWHRERKTIVFVTHSVEEALFLATRVIVMSARPGRVIADRAVVLPGDDQPGVRSLDVLGTPELAAKKAELARLILEAHG
ncbi:ATP-binding cassette domain-containing protein [Gordonia amarae]|uniref:ATP-binding cassette domain-containing protein n=2 Tax=Gordonia amarae TaxID=36821 RepID=A0A857KW59_9ACTN|nr:ABC transporter ATP-binding protein [Gordonia amarae]MCS3878354.1 ABC-type nitrate/sulfonate/bicarbonate transport system ATPase subunit [Gordonia amarae]QHN16995.1 ATP-binding cassette domain-containing protein [Gordonia amarae]QHN21521.1 ATP-binding cassette domain-containing protein [Gordonia amarae]QHN30371.1 ATP-binding cassette domain-containing protein [Gordonia amarae]QHN39148.1 ATP-binding cassette domain-containing protein [Gordonia amarae]